MVLSIRTELSDSSTHAKVFECYNGVLKDAKHFDSWRWILLHWVSSDSLHGACIRSQGAQAKMTWMDPVLQIIYMYSTKSVAEDWLASKAWNKDSKR